MQRVRWLAGRLGKRLLRWSGVEERRPDSGEAGREKQEQTTLTIEQEPEREPERPRGRSGAEVVTTALSLLLIGLLAGAILYDGYASGESQPAQVEIEVHLDDVDRRGDGYYVPLTISNTGDQTIEEVLITIEARRGEELVDETETVIATLAERGTVSAIVVLTDDPATLQIEAGVSTFQIADE
jgi:uncharacterized protein (TIGR02588 family)